MKIRVIKKGLETNFYKGRGTNKLDYRIKIDDPSVISILLDAKKMILKKRTIEDDDLEDFEYFVEINLVRLVAELKNKWINDIADWLEINDIGKQNGGKDFLAYFCDRMENYLTEDKKDFKRNLKEYRNNETK